MRVLITGAAGFLGRAFLRHHLVAGDDVTAVDDLSATGSFWIDGDYERVEDDAALCFAFWAVTAKPFDLAYHFAAPVGGRVKIEGDPLYNAHSLALDSAFFRWAPGNVATAVYPSSSAVYGIGLQRGDGQALYEELFDPTADLWPQPDQMYGFTKMAGEVLASHAAKYGLNTLCLRPFSGYGEEQSMDYPVPSICRRAANHEDPLVVWGSGHQTRDFIHVSDIVGATEALLARGIHGYEAINLGSGVATSFVEVAQRAAAICGYSPTIQTDDTKPEGVTSRFSDPSRMLSVYHPLVSLDEGLARIIRSLDPEA